MTLGSPPSITATHEFVVPRSMPMTLPILHSPRRRRQGEDLPPTLRRNVDLRSDLDLDVARLGLLGLGHVDLEHAVANLCLHRVAPDRDAESEGTLERP